jgi:hypothetical protein
MRYERKDSNCRIVLADNMVAFHDASTVKHETSFVQPVEVESCPTLVQLVE